MNQDWEPVIWRKPVKKPINRGSNVSQRQSDHRRLDDSNEVNRIEKPSIVFTIALRNARVLKCWSQTELAANININVSFIKEYESGKQYPTASVRCKLNRILGITLPKI